MKRKIIASFTLIVLLICSIFSLSGCSNYKGPKSIKIDDVEYVSGFYYGLYLVGVEYKEFSTSLFIEKNCHWWHLEDSTFDMYYCRHKDSLYWNPDLYCRKDQFDEVKSYYHNTDNFDYYLGIYLEDDSEIKLAEGIERNIIEQAISLIVDADNVLPSNPSKKYNRVKFDFEGKEYKRPTIYRKSHDGLFTTTRSEWRYYEEKLYISYDGGIINGSYNALVLEDAVNDYVVSLLKEYGLV